MPWVLPTAQDQPVVECTSRIEVARGVIYPPVLLVGAYGGSQGILKSRPSEMFAHTEIAFQESKQTTSIAAGRLESIRAPARLRITYLGR
jgi:hypothetical protein